MDVTFYRFDNAHQSLGIMRYITATHEEALDGTDILTIVTDVIPNKRDRIVWEDNTWTWHEHIIDSMVTQHVDGRVLTTCTCSNSISELYLFGIYGGVCPESPSGKEGVYYGGPDGLLDIVLKESTWYVGDSDAFPQIRIELWGKSVRQCIAEMCDLTGGELVTDITVGDTGVTRRKVAIVKKRGDQTAQRQFSYGRNIKSVKREVAADEVYTKVVAIGALINPDSPYTDRYMDSFNDGQSTRWGVMTRYATSTTTTGGSSSGGSSGGEGEMGVEDGNGSSGGEGEMGVEGDGDSGGSGDMGDEGAPESYYEAMGPSTMLYIDESVDDSTFLGNEAYRMQNTVTDPLIRYEFDALSIEEGGWESGWDKIGIGDAISISDEPMGIHMVERISHVKRTFVSNEFGSQVTEIKVCIGERPNFIADKFIAAEKVGQMTNGNSSRSNAKNPVYTGGTHGHGSGSGDGVAHTLDGSPVTGTIAFTSAQGS